MSFLSNLTTPPFLLVTAGTVGLALPLGSVFCSTAATLGLLQVSNVVSYVINCASVSVPGRVDGPAQDSMQDGKKKKNVSSIAKNSNSSTNDNDKTYDNIYSPGNGRSLIAPAGWAFAIWAPIYLGEAAFCVTQFYMNDVQILLPTITAPFVAANLFQSLWCASFRPSYMVPSASWWHKYVSVSMLGSTALCLAQCNIAAAALPFSWYFVPLIMHFGWTTAATLVNLNGSLALSEKVSDSTVIAVGHASTVVATVLGTTVAMTLSSPIYAMTVAWALAACADGMQKRQVNNGVAVSETIHRGMQVQQKLCWLGSGICVATALVVSTLLK